MSNGYPSGFEYSQVLQHPRTSFADLSLRNGTVVADKRGLPLPMSGNFSSVFVVEKRDGKRVAVKCFTHVLDDRHDRYMAISRCLTAAPRPWAVNFEYSEKGIRCNNAWYPLVIMEWIEAETLLPYLDHVHQEPHRVAKLADAFVSLVQGSEEAHIAHGDLQHGNILISPADKVYLVDYDGLYSPQTAQFGSLETGHPNYQSPHRTHTTWCPEMDRFSAWSIYLSLLAITIEPGLWRNGRDKYAESLLFSKQDYLCPSASLVLENLSRDNRSLRIIAHKAKEVFELPLKEVPPLEPLLRKSLAARAASKVIKQYKASTSSRLDAIDAQDAFNQMEALKQWVGNLPKPLPSPVAGADPRVRSSPDRRPPPTRPKLRGRGPVVKHVKGGVKHPTVRGLTVKRGSGAWHLAIELEGTRRAAKHGVPVFKCAVLLSDEVHAMQGLLVDYIRPASQTIVGVPYSSWISSELLLGIALPIEFQFEREARRRTVRVHLNVRWL